MTWNLESVTTAALSAAMSAGMHRQGAVAANIANAHTEGYVPLRLAFDASLADAREALREKGSLEPAQVASLRGELEPSLDASGAPGRVRLDEQMVELAGNAVHFQALAQGLSRHLSIQALAAGDGRR